MKAAGGRTFRLRRIGAELAAFAEPPPRRCCKRLRSPSTSRKNKQKKNPTRQLAANWLNSGRN